MSILHLYDLQLLELDGVLKLCNVELSQNHMVTFSEKPNFCKNVYRGVCTLSLRLVLSHYFAGDGSVCHVTEKITSNQKLKVHAFQSNSLKQSLCYELQIPHLLNGSNKTY